MMEEALISGYEKLYDELPSNFEDTWIKQKPAIPFIGEQYGEGQRPKVLVYGSAENLNYKLKPDKMTFLRNKEALLAWKRKEYNGMVSSKDNWFPHVHMTPVSDGTLLTAARYLLEVFNRPDFSEDPKEFLQQIAVGNYGKFSLKGGRNMDYASKPKLLKVSDAYVKADLKELKPEVVIVPRSIHWHALGRVIRELSDGGEPQSTPAVWTIYQTNAGVINRHINRQLNKNGWTEEKEREGWVQEWIDHIPKIRMGRYLDWIDWQKEKGGAILRTSRTDMTTSINSRLEAHFSEWAKEANIPPGHFHKDGVIHEES